MLYPIQQYVRITDEVFPQPNESSAQSVNLILLDIEVQVSVYKTML